MKFIIKLLKFYLLGIFVHIINLLVFIKNSNIILILNFKYLNNFLVIIIVQIVIKFYTLNQ